MKINITNEFEKQNIIDFFNANNVVIYSNSKFYKLTNMHSYLLFPNEKIIFSVSTNYIIKQDKIDYSEGIILLKTGYTSHKIDKYVFNKILLSEIDDETIFNKYILSSKIKHFIK